MVSMSKNQKPTKREDKYIFILMKSMYKIKELYNSRRDASIGNKCIVVLN
jgi:hypothetical protein